jgi:uncharacterized protein YndB with AHSA1/START domain
MWVCHIFPWIGSFGKEHAWFFSDQVNSVTEMQQNILSQPRMMATSPTRRKTAVALSLRIAADRRRVVHALSIPEYMEAWLQAPDPDELLFVFDLVNQENFRIRLYRAEGLHASIYGSSRVEDANRVTYIWKTTSRARTTETLVDMRLEGGSRGCTLRLKHSGFRDRAESAWHCRMWHQSMERLCQIIRINRL